MLNPQRSKENPQQGSQSRGKENCYRELYDHLCAAPRSFEKHNRIFSRAPLGSIQNQPGLSKSSQHALQRTSESERTKNNTPACRRKLFCAALLASGPQASPRQPLRAGPPQGLQGRPQTASTFSDQQQPSRSGQHVLPHIKAPPREDGRSKVPKCVVSNSIRAVHSGSNLVTNTYQHVEKRSHHEEQSKNLPVIQKRHSAPLQPEKHVERRNLTSSVATTQPGHAKILSGNKASIPSPTITSTQIPGSSATRILSGRSSYNGTICEAYRQNSLTEDPAILLESTTISECAQSQTRVLHSTTNATRDFTGIQKPEDSTISTTLAYNLDDTRNVTLRRTIENFNQSGKGSSMSPQIDQCIQNNRVAHMRGPVITVNDTPFVDGLQFFNEEPTNVSFENGYSVSPADAVRWNAVPSFNSACLRRPGIRNSLKRRNSFRAQDKKLFYSDEYLKDILKHLRTIESRWLVPANVVEQLVYKTTRTAFVNWLFQISEMQTPNNDPVFFMAVRLFDWTIANLKLREKSYRLAIAVSYWMATKYLTNLELKASKIYSLCNGKSTKMEILTLESSIIRKINFSLNMADPTDFLNCYLNIFGYETDKHLEYTTQFIMDCSALYESYMVTEPSHLVASAIALAYRLLCKSDELFYKFKWIHPTRLIVFADTVLTINVRYTVLKKYEPFKKYSTAAKLNVAQFFLNL